jgi:hypothetical protein
MLRHLCAARTPPKNAATPLLEKAGGEDVQICIGHSSPSFLQEEVSRFLVARIYPEFCEGFRADENRETFLLSLYFSVSPW